MHSRLTRWVNRLLPFNFKISHLPGKDMGFTDLLSRLPSGEALPISHYDEEFVVASIDKIQNILLTKQDSKTSRTEKCTTNCQPVGNSKFNFKSITFSDKVLLFFLLLNRHFIPSSKKNQNSQWTK